MQMGIRRFTRLTNVFSKESENPAHAVSLYSMYDSFCRPRPTLAKHHPLHYPTAPAMATGIADRVW